MPNSCCMKPRRSFWSPASPFDLWFVPQRIPTLAEFCLKAVAGDEALKLHLESIQDIPLDVLAKLYPELSVYGKALLEEKVSFKDYETEIFWKHHLKRLTSFQEADIFKQSNEEIDSFKSQYFERLLEEVLNRYAEEDSYKGDVPSSLLHFMQTSDLFNAYESHSPQEQLKELSRLFRKNLLRIRFNSYFLKPIKFILENFQPGMVTERIKFLDFHFRQLKQNQCSDICNIVNAGNFPNLTSVAFWRLIIDRDVMKHIKTIIEQFLDSFMLEEDLVVVEDSNRDSLQYVQDQSVTEELSEVAQKKMKSYRDTSDSFTEMFPCRKTAPANNTSLIPSCTNASYKADALTGCGSQTPNAPRCQIDTIEFFKCYFTENTVDLLCRMLRRIFSLRNFTIETDNFVHWSFTYKVLSALFGDNGNEDSKGCMESIKLHYCDLDYRSKKLLFWHIKGKCSDQFGINVPTLEHIELVDCNIDTFLCDCKCMNEPKIAHENQSSRHKLPLSLSKPLHTKECTQTFDWFFDPSLVCVCNWQKLKTIDLSNNDITCKGAASIALALEKTKQLKSVKMSNCNLKTKGCGSLFSMATRHVSLESLDVSHNSYNSLNDERLAILIENGNLLRLNIENCLEQVSNRDALLMAFAKNSKLVTLNLASNGLDDEDMYKFSQALAQKDTLSSLKELDLSKNAINSVPIKEFACALRESGRQLDDLQLAGNYVYISQLKAMDVHIYFQDHVRNWHRNSLLYLPPTNG